MSMESRERVGAVEVGGMGGGRVEAVEVLRERAGEWGVGGGGEGWG